MPPVIDHYVRAQASQPDAPLLCDARYKALCRTQMETVLRAVEDGTAADLGCWEPWTPQIVSEVKQARLFVDVGAERGLYTILARNEMPPGGRIVALEPDPVRAGTLAERFAGDRHVRIIKAAAWDVASQIQMVKPGACSATSVEVDGDTFCAQADSLGDVLGDQPVDLIKVDVEGAEARVLNGMKQLLADQRPQVFLEYHPWCEQVMPGSRDAIVQTIHQMRYRLFRMDTGSPVESDRIGGRMWLMPL